jgi:hypothetical protein
MLRPRLVLRSCAAGVAAVALATIVGATPAGAFGGHTTTFPCDSWAGASEAGPAGSWRASAYTAKGASCSGTGVLGLRGKGITSDYSVVFTTRRNAPSASASVVSGTYGPNQTWQLPGVPTGARHYLDLGGYGDYWFDT